MRKFGPRNSLTRSISALIVILVIIIAALGAYSASIATKSASTTTVVSTTNIGAGSVVTVTASAGAVTTTVSGSVGYQGLAQLAASEGGSLTIYGLIPQPIFNQYITTAFQHAYPWAKVTYSGLSAATLTTKALQEYQAKQVQADVICGNTPNIYVLNQSGVTQTFNNPELTLMGGYSTLYNSLYQPGNTYPLILAYNTNLVTNVSSLPKTWLDLTNPIWKGKIAFQSPTATGSVSEILGNLQYLYNMTSSQWQSWVTALAANNPILPSSGDQAFTDLQDGQVALAIVGLSSVFPSVANEPIAVDWMPYYFSTSVPCALANGAPQPNTGRLFLEWLASYSGQLATVQTTRTPAFTPLLPDWASTIKATIPNNATLLPAEFPQFFSNITFYQNFYKQVFG